MVKISSMFKSAVELINWMERQDIKYYLESIYNKGEISYNEIGICIEGNKCLCIKFNRLNYEHDMRSFKNEVYDNFDEQLDLEIGLQRYLRLSYLSVKE